MSQTDHSSVHGSHNILEPMKRTELLRHVLADCYCRLQPSLIHGIGVYAIRDIPKGKNPFETLPTYGRRRGYVRITDEELDALPPGLSRLLKALFVPTDGKMHIPTAGTNIVYLAAYVNHSATPNLRTADGFNFRARRRIREGEELTADYRTYGAEELLASH
jgi:uncharacterized protein